MDEVKFSRTEVVVRRVSCYTNEKDLPQIYQEGLGDFRCRNLRAAALYLWVCPMMSFWWCRLLVWWLLSIRSEAYCKWVAVHMPQPFLVSKLSRGHAVQKDSLLQMRLDLWIVIFFFPRGYDILFGVANLPSAILVKHFKQVTILIQSLAVQYRVSNLHGHHHPCFICCYRTFVGMSCRWLIHFYKNRLEYSDMYYKQLQKSSLDQ